MIVCCVNLSILIVSQWASAWQKIGKSQNRLFLILFVALARKSGKSFVSARIDFSWFYLRRLPENREKSIYRGLEPKQTIIPSFFVLFDHHCLLMWSLTLWLDTCSWIWLFLSHSLLLLLLSFSYDLPFHLFWWFTLFFTSLLIPLMLFIWLITFDGDRRSTLFVLDSHL